jgi:hypothetical protein
VVVVGVAADERAVDVAGQLVVALRGEGEAEERRQGSVAIGPRVVGARDQAADEPLTALRAPRRLENRVLKSWRRADMLVPDMVWSIGNRRITEQRAAPNTMLREQTISSSMYKQQQGANEAEMPVPRTC